MWPGRPPQGMVVGSAGYLPWEEARAAPWPAPIRSARCSRKSGDEDGSRPHPTEHRRPLCRLRRHLHALLAPRARAPTSRNDTKLSHVQDPRAAAERGRAGRTAAMVAEALLARRDPRACGGARARPGWTGGSGNRFLEAPRLRTPAPHRAKTAVTRVEHRCTHGTSFPGTPGTHDPSIHAGRRLNAGVSMGATGLEPVTPSLSIRPGVRTRSR